MLQTACVHRYCSTSGRFSEEVGGYGGYGGLSRIDRSRLLACFPLFVIESSLVSSQQRGYLLCQAKRTRPSRVVAPGLLAMHYSYRWDSISWFLEEVQSISWLLSSCLRLLCKMIIVPFLSSASRHWASSS